jgi:hypothetical protein
MRLLVCGCTATTKRLAALRPDRLGVLLTPRGGHDPTWAQAAGLTIGCDNDCFQGLRPAPWLRFLAKLVESGTRPRFVACPDRVADMAATWRMYDTWAPVLRSLGLPVALVVQDGLEQLRHRARLPWVWDEIDAIFVGGSTKFKEGPFARDVVLEAKRRGKWVHAGRVNSLRRIRRFAELGADSFDGSGFSAWGEKRMALAVEWIDRALNHLRTQPSLFTESQEAA